MKKGAYLILAVLLIVGTAWGKNFEITKKADDYSVTVTIDKNPPIVGKNNMVITVKDAAGKNIADAKVLVEYSMPAMPGMPAMNYKTEAGMKDDRHMAVIQPSMAGSWNVAIKVARAGKTSTAKLTIDVK